MAERTPPLAARDKLAFLLSLVPWLMDRDRVSVTEAAEHFGMSPEAVRDAVRLIAVSGVPGDTSSYQHDDLFDIAWDDFEENDQIVITHLVAIDDSPRFSAREAAALIAGLQYLSSLPENADSGAIASLMSKLSRGASGAPSQVAVAGAETDSTLAIIRDAVASGVQIDLDYVNSRGERERRRVDPLRVESVDADWYLRGWCHLREAVRTFRLDRISDPVMTSDPISHRASDVTLPETLFETSPDDIPVTIEVAAAAAPLIADYLVDGAPSVKAGERLRTSLRVSHHDGLKRLAASMPGVMAVLEPADARAAVRAWAEAGLAGYR
ncbi:MAG: WYL domain-containing protein [Microbacteriaceae bacterium]